MSFLTFGSPGHSRYAAIEQTSNHYSKLVLRINDLIIELPLDEGQLIKLETSPPEVESHEGYVRSFLLTKPPYKMVSYKADAREMNFLEDDFIIVGGTSVALKSIGKNRFLDMRKANDVEVVTTRLKLSEEQYWGIKQALPLLGNVAKLREPLTEVEDMSDQEGVQEVALDSYIRPNLKDKVLRIKFTDRAAADNFAIPAWLHKIMEREITDLRGYSDEETAVNDGFPG